MNVVAAGFSFQTPDPSVTRGSVTHGTVPAGGEKMRSGTPCRGTEGGVR